MIVLVQCGPSLGLVKFLRVLLRLLFYAQSESFVYSKAALTQDAYFKLRTQTHTDTETHTQRHTDRWTDSSSRHSILSFFV